MSRNIPDPLFEWVDRTSLLTPEVLDIGLVKLNCLPIRYRAFQFHQPLIFQGSSYHWLKKHDTYWLESHLPPSRSIVRFSWQEVDLELSERVKKVAKELIKSNPNTRVGKYAIINALTKQERGRIKSYLNNMPITANVLKNEAETLEEYQMRHVPAIVHQLRTYYNYTIIKVDTILSYRRSYRKCSIEMKNKIQAILDELNKGL
jgi:hypothetical protein